MNNKYFNTKRVFTIISVFIIALVMSCSKDKNNIAPEINGTKMVIKVDGILGTDIGQAISTKAAASVGSNQQLGTSLKKTASGFTMEAMAEQSAIGAVGVNNKLAKSVATKLGNAGTMAATQPMTQDFTYRILVYNKTTGALWKTVQAVAGTEVQLDVEKGSNYTWYAYSYNNTEALPEPANTANPTIEAPVNKDLLYATGETSIPVTPSGENHVYPIAITFQHKMAQVSVKIDATILAQYAAINGIKANFVQDNYLKKGTFDIKGNSMGNLEVVPTTAIFTTTSPTNIWEANYYTADPGALTSFQVKVTDLPVTFNNVDPSMANRNLATYSNATTPAPNIVFNFNFTSPAAGQRLLGLANLSYTATQRRILHYTSTALTNGYGYAAQSGEGWKFINADNNFGTAANSLLRVQKPWSGTTATSTNAGSANYANTQAEFRTKLAENPDVVIIGYNAGIESASTRTALIDYINRKGVVIMMIERSDNAPSVQLFMREFFNDNAITAAQSSYGSGGTMYRINNVNDEIVNGVFGDLRGKLWGEDFGETMVLGNMSPTTLSQIEVYSSGRGINRTPTAAYDNYVTMFKHKTKGLFFVGDGGFISNPRALTSNPDNFTDANRCPFGTDDDNRPKPRLYGTAGNGYTTRQDYAWNSNLFGNAVYWAVKRSEFDGFGTWKYAPAPLTP